MRKVAVVGVVACGVVAVLYGCVGDEPSSSGQRADSGTAVPTATTPTPDAGDPGALPVSDAATDAKPVGSCAGQPFGAPVQVDMSEVSAALTPTVVWGPRLSGSNAYFAAVPAPDAAFEQQLFRATFTPPSGASLPRMSNAALVVPPSNTATIEWAPVVASGPSGPLYLVYASGFPLRDLAFAPAAGGGVFGAPISGVMGGLNTAKDESDPWLVGSPPTAMYFAQTDDATPAHVRIVRATITASTDGGPPAFGGAQAVTLACPKFHCGTPVTSSDEKARLFAAWDDGDFVPSVHEITGTGEPLASTAHAELGTRYPSWVSSDGCEVLLGGQKVSTLSDIYYAKRAPK